MSLDFCCDIQMVGSEFAVKNMKAWSILLCLNGSGIGGGGVMVLGIFSWHTLVPLVPIEHRLNATADLSIVADHVHPFMTAVYPSSDDYFQQDNAQLHYPGKKRLVSWTWQWVYFTPQSPDLNPIEHLWDVVEREIHIMDVQPTNLQQLCDAIMTIWPKYLRNVYNTLLNLCHEEIRQFWRQKGVQQGVPNKVASECIWNKIHLLQDQY